MDFKLHEEPIILNHNRVKRAYVGGKLLDEWQGIEPAEDGQFPEEYLISTVEVTNVDKYPGEGLSKVTLEDGSEVSLKEIIESNPSVYLGKQYAEAMKGELGVLARVGDPIVRHVIQAHPNQVITRNYLDFPYGKDEVWYVIKTREIDEQKPYAYVGFKKGVTRERWKELFKEQNVQGMLDSLNKIEGIKEGDVLLIRAGTPHAIGPGSMFLEVHEPCDYTFRMEKKFITGRTFDDHEIHYGIGTEGLLDVFSYKTYDLDEVRKTVVIQPKLIRQSGAGKEYQLISYEHTPRFAMNKIVCKGDCEIANFNGHRIAIVTKGRGKFVYPDGEKNIKQGQGIFLPSGLCDLKLYSVEEIEVITAFPPLLDKDI
jgi:mannose-6-phosphate isomerase